MRLTRREGVPQRRKWWGRPIVWLTLSYLTTAACGGQGGGGCAGCSGTAIPGGFPASKLERNGGQVRLSADGIAFIEQNLGKLITAILPGGLSFAIPSDCTSSPSICCNRTCSADITLDSVDISPDSASRLNLGVRASVQTSPIRIEQDLFIYTLRCDLTFNTADSAPNTIGLDMGVDLTIDPANGEKLTLARQALQISDFQCGDLTISGGFDCSIADFLCPLFRGTIESALVGPIESALDDLLGQIPTGSEGRYDLDAVLGSAIPGTSHANALDLAFWAGGYAANEGSGVSAGVLTGFEAVAPSSCVPSCEGAGATCQPPSNAAIPRSTVFAGNTRPDGQSFHVGLGIHRQAIDHALYAFYKGGAICLDIGTELTTQLNSGLFGLLLPSINTLTGSKIVPMMIAIRPRKPPVAKLGQGTYHQDPDGNVVIDDPLITVHAEDLAIDVYALIEHRDVRLFTVLGQLDLPILLNVDGNGALQPVLGDLSKALTNVKVENNDLLAEDPKALEAIFPTLLGLAAGSLSSSFAPIELPQFSGLALRLDAGSITSVDSNTLLAIFAKLALVQTTSARTNALGRAETTASVEGLSIPRTRQFAVTGPEFDPSVMPHLTLRLDANVPQQQRGKALEYSYAIDGGFYRPWTRATRVTVRDPLLWLQGHHTLYVKARVAGEPQTADLSPQLIGFTIDTVAPSIALVRTGSGYTAAVEDAVTSSSNISLRWVVDGKRLATSNTTIEAADDALIEVYASDEAGNTASVRRYAFAVPTRAGIEDPAAAGCQIGAETGAGPLGLLLFLGLVLLLRRRRNRRR